MSKRKIGRAEATIAFGARVLYRHGRVSPAPEGIANATALETPPWKHVAKCYRYGDFVSVEMDTDQTGRDLHALANGPINDPKALFLPAGKLTEAQYKARTAEQFARAGIKDHHP